MNIDYEIKKVKEMLEDTALKGPERRALTMYLESLCSKKVNVNFTNKINYDKWLENGDIV